jgi:aldehyde dehydrogenase (NAD+)
VVVDATADVARAAERIVWGKCINAGQTCVAPDYVLVDERVAPAFVAAAAAAVTRFYGASEAARRASRDFPRAIDDAAFGRLAGLLLAAVAAGARVAVGGRVDAAERYVAPTILTDVPWEAALMQEEIFGPILPVLTFRSLDEAIGRIAAGGTPLALYVFSRRRANVERVLARTASGGVAVNTVVVHLGNPWLPFGGVGQSGQGSYHGPYGFRAFSHERAVLRQGPLSLLRFYYPPYGPRTRRALQLVRRFLT